MRYTYFKELTSKILSIVIGILFILLVGTTNIPMQASAEEFDKLFPYKEKLKLPGQLFG